MENSVDKPQQADDENKLIAERRAKLAALREQGQAFPSDFRRTALAGDLQRDYEGQDKVTLESADERFSVAGRLIRNRGAFLLIQDGSGTIQLYLNRDQLSDEAVSAIKTWDLGDIVAASGPLHRSGKGDLYINMEEGRLLTKALRPLPDKYHGLVDQETRYRQRYVDLIVNPEVREIFRIRAATIQFIRQFLAERQFVEVETPMLHPIAGGATARPFITHHNALDMEMYLRVAPELYLKRLTVGGLEKVFEINRNFRNEGLSTRHNPEFTMLEFYWAYADFHDAMDLTEALMRELTLSVLGSTEVSYGDHTFHFDRPFTRLTVVEAILKYNPDLTAGDIASRNSAAAEAERLGIQVQSGWGLGKIQIEMHRFIIARFLRRHLSRKPLRLILCVIKLTEAVRQLAAPDKKFETIRDERVFIISPRQG